MKTNLSILEKIFYYFLLIFSFNLSVGQACQNHFSGSDPIQFSFVNTTNSVCNGISVSDSTVYEDDGVLSYNVYVKTIMIPFYANTLTGGIKFYTPMFYFNPNNNQIIDADIQVNNTVYNANYYVVNTPLIAGNTYNFNVKSKLNIDSNSSSITCSSKYFRIKIIKEAVPNFNLTLQAYCKKNNQNLYNGFIGFRVNGNFSNINDRYFFIATNSSNTCNQPTQYSFRLTNLSSSGIFNMTEFYDCNSNSTYTINLSHRFISLTNNPIIHNFSNGELGWNNYLYTKTFKSCINKINIDEIKGKNSEIESANVLQKEGEIIIYPNPVFDVLRVEIIQENINKIIVIDSFGKIVSEYDSDNLSNTKDINTANLSPDIYILKVITNQSTYFKKFIKI